MSKETTVIEITSFNSSEGFNVLQFKTSKSTPLDIILLDEALQKGFIEIQELSESGSVNEITVINKSPHLVFLMDGDLLQGAKQNRVLNTSVLLAPHSTTILPVSCVEQGRWNYRSARFTSVNRVSPADLRKEKARQVTSSRRTDNSARSDQGKVWEKVHYYSEKFKVRSGTSDLNELSDNMPNFNRSSFFDFQSNLKADPEATGVCLIHNGKVLSLDNFNSSKMLSYYLPKILSGIAMDVYQSSSSTSLNKKDSEALCRKMLADLETSQATEHPGVGCGTEKRFTAPMKLGFELKLEDSSVHFTGFQE